MVLSIRAQIVRGTLVFGQVLQVAFVLKMALDRIWVSCPCCKRRRTIQNSGEYDDDYEYYYYCDSFGCTEMKLAEWYEYYRYWDAYHYWCYEWWHYFCAVAGAPASEPIIQ